VSTQKFDNAESDLFKRRVDLAKGRIR